jgi:probable rRNA maturation factor
MPPAPQRLDRSKFDDAGPPHSQVRVDVANQSGATINERRLAAAVQLAFADAACSIATVSVAIVDDSTIHRLNRQFLEHDYATDVLSFVLQERPILEGEIIASSDAAERAAAEAGWSAQDELLLYVVHGSLHLVGHRDQCDDDAAAMRAAERSILERLGVRVSPVDPRWSAQPPATLRQEAPQR